MLAALLVVLLAGLIVAGTFFWLGRRETTVSGPPELIKAEAGPYKVKPTNPGGLDISGESETAFETSAGEDKDLQLDLNKLPETPVAKPPKVEPAAPPAKPRRLSPRKRPRRSPPAGRAAWSSSAHSPTRPRRSVRGRRFQRAFQALPRSTR